ncbi:Carboxylic ester hydrolase [Sergentomyia squamirostris]
MSWSFSIVFLIAILVTVGAEVDLKVCFSSGCILGKNSLGYHRPYQAFLGIPYARPPIAGQRFRNPEPTEGWDGVRNCTTPANVCPQKELWLGSEATIGNENCLYLNVYRPLLTNPQSQRLPVIAYIHGGGFLFGSAHPDLVGPEHFMDNGTVILVTIQYRLGALGFLCSGDSASQGNFGLKDQVLALKWIQDNIVKFGGNPRLVTLIGESMGSVSAQVLMTNPQTRYYFRRAILLSGSMLAQYSVWNSSQSQSVRQFRNHAASMNLSNSDSRSTQDLVEEMRKVDLEDIMEATSGIQLEDSFIPYKLCVEGRWAGALVQEDPREVWKKGTYRHRSWMMGILPNEGSVAIRFIRDDDTIATFNENLDENIARLFELDLKLVPAIRKYYLGGAEAIDESNKMGFLKMVNDRLFYYPFYESVRQYIQYGSNKGTPVYLTKFNYRGTDTYTNKFFDLPSDHSYGVGHADDLNYLFTASAIFQQRFPKDSIDATMAQKYVANFVEFATLGKPLNPVARKCNRQNFDPFCDYQEFRRRTFEVKLPTDILQQQEEVEVIVTNSFDIDMVTFWKELLV